MALYPDQESGKDPISKAEFVLLSVFGYLMIFKKDGFDELIEYDFKKFWNSSSIGFKNDFGQ